MDRRVYLRKLTNEREFPTFGLKPERIKSSTTLVQRDTEILDRVNSFPSKLIRKTTSVTVKLGFTGVYEGCPKMPYNRALFSYFALNLILWVLVRIANVCVPTIYVF